MGAAGRAVEIEDAAGQQVTTLQSVDRFAQECAQAVRVCGPSASADDWSEGGAVDADLALEGRPLAHNGSH